MITITSCKIFILISALMTLFINNYVLAQTKHDTLFSINQESASYLLQLGGTLDGINTFSRTSDGGFTKAFDPMLIVSLTNIDTVILSQPRIVFNNSGNWFTMPLLTSEILKNANTPKEKALSLWKFMVNNRIHRDLPENDPSWEERDALKVLGVYGISQCGNTAVCIASVAYQAGYSSRYWNMTGHIGTEVKFDTSWSYIDSDLEAFFLNRDNSTIAGKSLISDDRDLIRRTHLYGKYYQDNFSQNETVASIFNDPGVLFDAGYNFDFYDQYGFSRDHTLDYSLRPGESIIYDYSNGKILHELKDNGNPPKPNEYANGYFDYKPDFSLINLSKLADSISNLTSYFSDNLSPFLHPALTNSQTSAIIKISSPFVIVDGKIKFIVTALSANDSVSIFFSKDGSSWQQIWYNSSNGKISDSVNIYDFIGTKNTSALYSYYLKFCFLSKDLITSCGLDSLDIRTTFQVSRFFLPNLKLGDNVINFTSANVPNAKLGISWQETSLLKPPYSDITPVFPLDESNVDSTQFTFIWTKPSDPNGYTITDYEFELSDRLDMKYPLSPTFDRYISSFGKGIQTNFIISTSGMLNDGTAYFWHVRAKNSGGVWGDWSPTWYFIPHGAMAPVNVRDSLTQNSIILKWDNNTSGKRTVYYRIYGSNESNGFSPSYNTIIDSTANTSYNIPLSNNSRPYTFYRIIAVDNNTNISQASDLITIKHPWIVSSIPVVYPNNSYQINLLYDSTYTNIWRYEGYLDQLKDNITINLISKPSWLSYNAQTNSLAGYTDSLLAHRILFDTSLSTINLQLSDGRGGSNYQSILLKSSIPNSQLYIMSIDTLIQVNQYYRETIKGVDIDTLYGDKINMSMISKPSWLNTQIDSSYIILSGTPGKNNNGDSVISISAVDKIGSKVTRSFTLRVNDPPNIISSPITNAIEDSAYIYNAYAVDPDSIIFNDKVHYRLLNMPSWLNVDSTTGKITGIAKISNLSDTLTVVSIEAIDNNAGFTIQNYNLEISHTNHMPVFIQYPDTLCKQDSLYNSYIKASDIDSTLFGDKVSYHLENNSSWLNIDTVSGRIYGTPKLADTGKDTIKVLATDNKGGLTSYSYMLNVMKRAHVFNYQNSPVTVAREDTLYQYQIIVNDSVYNQLSLNSIAAKGQLKKSRNPIKPSDYITNSGLNYYLIGNPSWLHIDTTNGLITGIPRGKDVGIDTVTVKIINTEGFDSIYSYQLNVVHTNHAPVFIQYPDTISWQDSLYSSYVKAIDQDSALFGDKLSYHLESNPTWMGIDTISGKLYGTPGLADTVKDTIKVEVTDNNGGLIYYCYVLNVLKKYYTFTISAYPDTVAKEDSVYITRITASSSYYYYQNSKKGTQQSTSAIKKTNDFSKAKNISPEALKIKKKQDELKIKPVGLKIHQSDSLQAKIGEISSIDEVYYTFTKPIKWLTIDSLSGIIWGTPDNEAVGNDSIGIRITNSDMYDTTYIFVIKVEHTNHAPSIPDMLTPPSSDTVKITNDSTGIKFVWSKSQDNDTIDTLRYIVNMKVNQLDTNIVVWGDTTYTVDKGMFTGIAYNDNIAVVSWNIRATDGNDTVSNGEFSMLYVQRIITGLSKDNLIPKEYEISQNYPNPFNPVTTIDFGIPEKSEVKIIVYNILGQLTETIVNSEYNSGYYKTIWNPKNLSSGIYLINIKASSLVNKNKYFNHTIKSLYVK
jgi:hypothetical protein